MRFNETDTIAENERFLLLAAEQQIMQQHSHRDGSPIMLHEIGADETIGGSQLEGKLDSIACKKSGGSSDYGPAEFDSADFASQSKKETLLMGCNCGAEWTVTGKSMSEGSPVVKVEQYVSAEGNSVKYGNSSSQQPQYKQQAQ